MFREEYLLISLARIVIRKSAVFHFAVVQDVSVANVDDAFGMLRDILFVCNQNNCAALFSVQSLKCIKYDFAGFCVKVSCWFVSKNKSRVIDKGASDRDSLRHSSRELV